MGLSNVANMKYGLIFANPKDYYHETHRTSHFIKFNKQDADDDEKDVVDLDNYF